MGEQRKINLDDLVDKLLMVGQPGISLTSVISEAEIQGLCQAAREVFLSQSTFIELDAPVKICGDIHGQYFDLMRLFNRGGFPPTSNYLFLGDYVDRGKQNLETICLMLAYKVLYKENFFLLRGNHECAPINRVYGFYDECQRRYSTRVWQMFQEVFNCMPFTALVANKILCMHGGLSQQLNNFDQLRMIKRPIDPPNPSLLMDLLWADPDKWTRGFSQNTRGVSFVFGQDVVSDTCQRLSIDMVARAHQVVQDGYEFFASRKLVTLFSAPHYCGEFDNAAALMTVDTELQCTFEVLRPVLPKVTSDKK